MTAISALPHCAVTPNEAALVVNRRYAFPVENSTILSDKHLEGGRHPTRGFLFFGVAFDKKPQYYCRRFERSVGNGAVVQLVRMPACHAGGREFESRPLRKRKPPKGGFCIPGFPCIPSTFCRVYHQTGSTSDQRTTSRRVCASTTQGTRWQQMPNVRWSSCTASIFRRAPMR